MKYSIDTRTINPGDIFIPIKGPNFDGNDFIEEALKKDASQILKVDLTEFAENYRKNLNIPIIAITGSSGKTTTKDLLYSILSQKYKVNKTHENFNNEIGVPLTLINTDNADLAIIEMGMRGLNEIKHLTSIVLPSHCVITNIGYTHLERLGTQPNIALAKSEIFTRFDDSPKKIKAYFPDHIHCFDIVSQKAIENNCEIINTHSNDITMSNIDLATKIATDFGLSSQEIQKGIEKFKPSSNRQEKININNITLINDSYNSNPDSVEFALKLMKKETGGRTIAVLGDMLELGELEITFHRNLGQQLEKNNIDIVFSYGKLSSNIKTNITHKNFMKQPELSDALLKELKPGDTVLFKGSRSMHLEKVFEDIKKRLLI